MQFCQDYIHTKCADSKCTKIHPTVMHCKRLKEVCTNFLTTGKCTDDAQCTQEHSTLEDLGIPPAVGYYAIMEKKDFCREWITHRRCSEGSLCQYVHPINSHCNLLKRLLSSCLPETENVRYGLRWEFYWKLTIAYRITAQDLATLQIPEPARYLYKFPRTEWCTDFVCNGGCPLKAACPRVHPLPSHCLMLREPSSYMRYESIINLPPPDEYEFTFPYVGFCESWIMDGWCSNRQRCPMAHPSKFQTKRLRETCLSYLQYNVCATGSGCSKTHRTLETLGIQAPEKHYPRLPEFCKDIIGSSVCQKQCAFVHPIPADCKVLAAACNTFMTRKKCEKKGCTKTHATLQDLDIPHPRNYDPVERLHKLDSIPQKNQAPRPRTPLLAADDVHLLSHVDKRVWKGQSGQASSSPENSSNEVQVYTRTQKVDEHFPSAFTFGMPQLLPLPSRPGTFRFLMDTEFTYFSNS